MLFIAVSAEVLFNCTMDSIILCGLTQGQTDEFDWSRHAGTTSSANTGPTMDHTGAAGLGIYILGNIHQVRSNDKQSKKLFQLSN